MVWPVNAMHGESTAAASSRRCGGGVPHLRVALLAAALLAVAHRLVLGAARLELVRDGLLARLLQDRQRERVRKSPACGNRPTVRAFSDLVLWMFSISTRLFLNTLPFTCGRAQRLRPAREQRMGAR